MNHTAKGLRLLGKRREDGTATYYLWDGLRLLETRNADGTLKARFTHGHTPIEGIGSCVEVHRASDSKRYYMLYDHRGTAHAVLDESKTEVARRLYNAFGELISESGAWPAEVPFGYQSNWLDLTTLPDGSSLYLSPTRPYHAGTGLFLQRDFLPEAVTVQASSLGNALGEWSSHPWVPTILESMIRQYPWTPGFSRRNRARGLGTDTLRPRAWPRARRRVLPGTRTDLWLDMPAGREQTVAMARVVVAGLPHHVVQRSNRRQAEVRRRGGLPLPTPTCGTTRFGRAQMKEPFRR